MDPNSIRFQQYQKRLDADKESFLFDVQLWSDALPAGTHIKHHVSQFHDLCEQAIKCLEEEYEKKGPSEAQDKKLTFRSSVVGALSAQWAALRQAAEQRLPEHPYQARLVELDEKAARYYWRIRQAIPERTREKISKSPPLTYLGRGANLTLIQPGMPSLLGVPFGAINTGNPLSTQLTENTIPHEVAHAVLNQISNFVFDLESKTQQVLRKNIDGADPANPSSTLPLNQREILHGTFRKWLNEVVADLVGTALAGREFVESAVHVMIAPDEAVTLSEDDHPVAIIRPFIHLEAMRSLSKDGAALMDDVNRVLKSLKELIERTSGDYVRQLFHPSNNLTVLQLNAVRDELVWIVRQLLTIKLDAFDDSLEAFLKTCSAPMAEYAKMEVKDLPQWGAEGNINCDGLALRLLSPVSTQHSTPFTYPYDPCCWIGWNWCC